MLSFLFVLSQLRAPQKESEKEQFIISEKDYSSRKVIERLEEEGFIRSSLLTRMQAKLKGYESVYKGVYTLDKSWSSQEVLEYLSNSENGVSLVSVQLTEGFWAKHMADALEKALGHNQEKYLKLWNDPTYIKSLKQKYPFITDDVLKQKDARVLLEGYLYPDTYLLNPLDSEEKVTEYILDNALEKYREIEKDLEDFPLSVHELYTFASIVEYEAPDMENMRKIAGVFMNRLKKGMKLEASPTICYSLYDFDDWKECEKASNNQIDSPYNTYRNPGLPPGPILNPSIKALKASLNYDENEYYFFIADVFKKKDGGIHFQKTYEEHEKVRKELLGY